MPQAELEGPIDLTKPVEAPFIVIDRRQVRDPAARISQGGVKVRTLGFPGHVLFRLWSTGPKKAVDGTYLGECYRVAELPVSERHNGGEGFQELNDTQVRIAPSAWLRCGWRTMDTIPPNWREHNAKLDARSAEIEVQFSMNNPVNKIMGDVASALHELVAQRSASNAAAVRDVPPAGADAGARRPDAAPASERGARGNARGGGSV